MTDSRYTGANALSAGKSISDVTSFSADTPISEVTSLGSAANISAADKPIQTASANSGISTMAASATTCYKKKAICSDGGYYASIPSGKKCTSVNYNGLTCYKDCEDEYFTYTVELCLDIRDKNSGLTRDTFCGFNNLYITAEGKYFDHVYGTTWTGPNSGPEMNCVSEKVTFKSSTPTIEFSHLPLQSTWTCGYYTTMCDGRDTELYTTDSLTMTKSTIRGAYIDYEYRIRGDARITVIYNCT